MSDVIIHPGEVDWSGDNPGMFLRETADGPYVTLMVWFRVAVSDYGPGRALLLFEDPNRAAYLPSVANLCITDNEPLAEYLVENFCKRFGAFRGASAFDALPITQLMSVKEGFEDSACYTVSIQAAETEVALRWEQLDGRFAADVPPAKSATGMHEMYSCFVEAHQASIHVNGRRLKGQAFPRDFLGRSTSSAFLAFSETWIRN